MKLPNAISILIILLFIGSIKAQTFQDDPSNEPDGDFPKNWELIKGSAQIMTFEGEKVINMAHGAIITPYLNNKAYLSDDFTLEFEAYFDQLE